jgi:hypothetical protein
MLAPACFHSALSLPINLLVVLRLWDYGMENEQGAPINLDKFADLTGFETDGSFLYPQDEKQAEKAYRQLRAAADKCTVYRRRDVPSYLHYDDDVRIGDPLSVANGPSFELTETPTTLTRVRMDTTLNIYRICAVSSMPQHPRACESWTF